MRTYPVPEGASAEQQHGHAEVLAVHAAVLPTNKVVYFSGDQHDPGQFANRLFDRARIFDCETGEVQPCVPSNEITDLFCCGHALLPDGRLLIAGGTSRFDPFLGDRAAWVFDPDTVAFNQVRSMGDGRWYPTLVTLGNGDVLAVSGINAGAQAPGGPEPEDQNRDLESFRLDGEGGVWMLQGLLPDPTGTLYPRLHLLPDGRVLFVTPIAGECATWRPGEPTPQPLCAHPLPRADAGFAEYTSVLLPLLPEDGYTPRVLVGNLPQPRLLVIEASPPEWKDTGPRRLPPDGVLDSEAPARVNGMMVLLPTGEVLACGGEAAFGDDDHPVQPLEIYHPETNRWETLPVRTEVTRGYHSVALLLPDGRVWLAGSNKRCDWSFHDSVDFKDRPQPSTEQQVKTHDGTSVPVDNRELRIEIFEPWYVGRSDRPSLDLGSDVVEVGGELSVASEEAGAVVRVALLRAGSTTHGFNSDQRFVSIPFRKEEATLVAELPDNESLLPPGPWLVFLLVQVSDRDGGVLTVPSEGKWIRIESPVRQRMLMADREPIEALDLSQVAIRPIDPELLERQRSMEGMHHGGVEH